ncbi:RAMP superfamily CRISPR-associated protein [Aciditerrimonas ferrireducens]|uniref:RAMP superfamily CRISPR-associated protein n=1 Tax=Aciditerrimonas ferrireducens TaxID=667306 RepID=UPI00200489FC|nr:RAMP superfamily CRISPR-associated protein [Aciditerrimonas ferrireducens]MCK4176161.1 hypothetical protein [Aciditerrimonas ferrireducens]
MISRGADQTRAELRLTELKSLMRLWWRRWWWGSQESPTVEGLRTEEARLFGGPDSPGGDPVPSSVRLRAVHVNLRPESLEEIFDDRPRAKAHGAGRGRRSALDAASWRARGRDRNPQSIQRACCLQGSFTVRFELPATSERTLLTVLWLVDRFGTLGSRASNGWGSLRVTEVTGSHPEIDGGPRALVAPDRAQLLRDTRTQDGWPSGLIGLHEGAAGGQVLARDLQDAVMALSLARRSVASIEARGSSRPAPTSSPASEKGPRRVNALRLRVDTDLSPDGSPRPGQPWFARWYLTGPPGLDPKAVNDALVRCFRAGSASRDEPLGARWRPEPWDPWGSSGGG